MKWRLKLMTPPDESHMSRFMGEVVFVAQISGAGEGRNQRWDQVILL